MHTRLLVLSLLSWTLAVATALVTLPDRVDRSPTTALEVPQRAPSAPSPPPQPADASASSGHRLHRVAEPIGAGPVPLPIALYALARLVVQSPVVASATGSPARTEVPRAAPRTSAAPKAPAAPSAELLCGPWEPLVQGPLAQRVRRCELPAR